MIRSWPEANTFRTRLAPLAWLEAYATTYRYPRTKGSISDPPSVEKLAAVLSLASDLLDALAQHFDVVIEAKGKPAGKVAPPR